MTHSQRTELSLLRWAGLGALAAVLSLVAVGSAAGEPPVEVKHGTSELHLSAHVEYERLDVTVSSGDALLERALTLRDEPVVKLVDAKGKPLPDGRYAYEIRVVPKVAPKVRQELARLREKGDLEGARRLREEAGLSGEPLVATGSFSLVEGRLVSADEREAEPEAPRDPGSLEIAGNLTVAGKKSFVAIDPADPASRIHYVSLEGPEAGTYYRGSASTWEGEARIDLPEHFARVTAPDGLTVQLTPTGEWSRLYVVEKTPQRLVVRSADGAEVEFDFLIQGVRREHRDHRVVQPADR